LTAGVLSSFACSRNFIRQTIMPLMRERWPGINKTINRSASHCSSGQELLDELAEQDLHQAKASETSLYICVLKGLSSARFNNLIRYFLSLHHCLMPSTEQVNQLKLQLQANEDKTPAVKVGAYYLRRFKGAIYLTPDYKDVSSWQAEIDLFSCTSELALPDQLGELVFTHTTAKERSILKESSVKNDKTLTTLCLPKEGQQATIRFSHDNPKCLPTYRQHSRSVKKILQELTLAPWKRRRIAFLYYDNELVSALGYFVCQAYVPKNNQPSICVNWFK